MTTRMKRSAGLIAVAAMAMLVLTACLNVTYKLTINSDATVSGALKAGISKEVMTSLGVTSKEQLDDAIVTGKLDTGVNGEVSQDCVVTDDATNWIITCTVANAQITDINEAWSLTKDDGNLTLKVVSDNQVDAAEEELMPDMDLGSLSFTATFPGPISSITGNGATKVNDNTFTIEGSLNESFDVTVVAASEPSGSTMKLLILVILAIAVLAVFVVAIVLLVKGKKKDEPAETVMETPPTADSSDPSI
jgi:hypothetical protein